MKGEGGLKTTTMNKQYIINSSDHQTNPRLQRNNDDMRLPTECRSVINFSRYNFLYWLMHFAYVCVYLTKYYHKSAITAEMPIDYACQLVLESKRRILYSVPNHCINQGISSTQAQNACTRYVVHGLMRLQRWSSEKRCMMVQCRLSGYVHRPH